jgi:hypothetical protein
MIFFQLVVLKALSFFGISRVLDHLWVNLNHIYVFKFISIIWVILVFMSHLQMSCFFNVLDRKSLIELMCFYMLFQGLIAVNYVGCLVCSSSPTQSNGRIVVEMELLLVTESSCAGHTRQTCFSDTWEVKHLKVWYYLMPLVELEGLRCIRLLWTWCIHYFDVCVWSSLEES